MRSILTIRLILLGTMALFVSTASAAQAKQTSLDSQIFQVFERIDDRTNVHEQDIAVARARLDKIGSDIKKLQGKLAALSTGSSDKNLGKARRKLHGQLISMSAEYLSQSFRLVDSAAAVISANLSDLAKLAKDVRKSADPSGGALSLQNRIQQNVAAGQSMRNALIQLRTWAKQDPSMVGRFQSLRRITMALDRRVSVDKTRLKSRHVGSTGAIRNKRLEALDHSVDQLGDMYAEVTAEKDALRDLRDELRMVIQLSRLEMTQEIANRAIPRIDGIKALTTGVNSLKDMAVVITDLNNSMVVEAISPEPALPQTSPVGSPAALEIGGFSNF